ncbi:hypothetical protein BCR35DRAFT_54705 [Leucosporidium creatinivorum]|uniref:Uncharacterized protein n=1 Tax=Leucosporidium creatinivorum TaxID=106004 RepID=A0A1Y2FPZ7_9BASI|nr:hypothetical protein BCR35DRAFT_54705 [Leucosporidium creatinivorum]
MPELRDRIPKLYGVWKSENGEGIGMGEEKEKDTMLLLMECGGKSIERFEDLSLSQRIFLYSTLKSLHYAGFEHHGFLPSQFEERRCRGEDTCVELINARKSLHICVEG